MTSRDPEDVPLLVDSNWLAAQLADSNLVVVDTSMIFIIPPGGGYYEARSGRDIYRDGHIPGAVFADLLHDLADESARAIFTALASETFAKRIGRLGIGNDDHVVIYDQGPMTWATRLWWNLRLEGFDRASVLEGGLPAWRSAGLPVTAGDEARPPKAFTARRRPELCADSQDVLAALKDEGTVLIDVLSPQSFRGEVDTYARPGHIPGAKNVPVSTLYRDSSLAATQEQIRDAFAGTEALEDDKQVIAYCGSGIAATYAAFSLARLGRSDVAVYDGSLTEWAANPHLPMETRE